MLPESNQSRSTSKNFFKHIYVGSIDPSLSTVKIKNYFQRRNLKLVFNNGVLNRTKNYVVAKTFDRRTFRYLTKEQKEHKIEGFTVKTDVFLTGEEKLVRDAEVVRRKVYVGNLPRKIQNHELKRFFSALGPVQTAYVNEKGNRPRGAYVFGFVTFEDEETARKLVQSKFFFLDGRRVFVKKFKTNWQKGSHEGDEEPSEEKRKRQEQEQKKKKIIEIKQKRSIKKMRRLKSNQSYPQQSLRRPYSGGYSARQLHSGNTYFSRGEWYLGHCSYEQGYNRQSESHCDQDLLQFISNKHSYERGNLRLNLGSRKKIRKQFKNHQHGWTCF